MRDDVHDSATGTWFDDDDGLVETLRSTTDHWGNAPEIEGHEPEQAQYPVERCRMLVLPYRENAEQEFASGDALMYNFVMFNRMMGTIGKWGAARAKELCPVMEVMPPIPAIMIGKLDTRNTAGNKFNLTREEDSKCAANVKFVVEVQAADLRGFLEMYAFKPSMEWLDRRFKHLKQGPLLPLDHRYPHVKVDPFHDFVVGASPQRAELWDIICLNNFSGYINFLFPEPGKPRKWKLAVLTSQWFPRGQVGKHTKKGQDQQAEILTEIGKLSEEEADKCLERADGAKYALDQNMASVLIYAMRVYDEQVPRVAATGGEEVI